MADVRPVYKPSQVMRLVKKGTIADPQPEYQARILCEAKRHKVDGETESPTFWENGSYVYCQVCRAWVLARIEFMDFAIDLTGERKKYPLYKSSTR